MTIEPSEGGATVETPAGERGLPEEIAALIEVAPKAATNGVEM